MKESRLCDRTNPLSEFKNDIISLEDQEKSSEMLFKGKCNKISPNLAKTLSERPEFLYIKLPNTLSLTFPSSV